jgi:hypothetical protein
MGKSFPTESPALSTRGFFRFLPLFAKAFRVKTDG